MARPLIIKPNAATAWLQWLLLVVLYIGFANRFWFDFGPDFVNYNAIARQYAAGNWGDAVNTWWSPLYSWLLAAVQTLIPDPLTSNKILQCLAATGGWWTGRRIIRFHTGTAPGWPAEIITTATVPFWVYWGLRSDTPDLISAVLLLQSFYGMLQLQREYKQATAISTGILAGLAYLCKAYNFYFITVAGILLLVAFMIRIPFKAADLTGPQKREDTNQPLRLCAPACRSLGEGRLVAKKWLTVALPFLLISFTWMFIMQQKTGRWQPSAIGVHQPCTDSLISNLKPHPEVYDCAGLQLHPGSLISNWEQPQLYPMVSLSHQLRASESGMLKTVLQNAGYYMRDFSSKWLWALLVLLLCICGSHMRRWWWLYGLYYGLFVAGYCLLHLEARFFIMPGALVMLTTGWLLVTAVQKWEMPLVWPLAIAATAFLYMYWPLHGMRHFERRTTPCRVYEYWKKEGSPIFRGQHMAAAPGLFDDGLYFSFYSGARFYGAFSTAPDSTKAGQINTYNIQKVLRKDGADTYRLSGTWSLQRTVGY